MRESLLSMECLLENLLSSDAVAKSVAAANACKIYPGIMCLLIVCALCYKINWELDKLSNFMLDFMGTIT